MKAQSLKSDWAFCLEGKHWLLNDKLNAAAGLFAKCGAANPEGFVLISDAAIVEPGGQQFRCGNKVSFQFRGNADAFVLTNQYNLPAYSEKLVDHGFECTYIAQIQLLCATHYELSSKNIGLFFRSNYTPRPS